MSPLAETVIMLCAESVPQMLKVEDGSTRRIKEEVSSEKETGLRACAVGAR
jgi:hypothetical protein